MAASSLRQVGKALDADVELGGRSTPSTGAYVLAAVSGLCFALAGLFFVPVLTAFSDMAFKPVTEWNTDITPPRRDNRRCTHDLPWLLTGVRGPEAIGQHRLRLLSHDGDGARRRGLGCGRWGSAGAWRGRAAERPVGAAPCARCCSGRCSLRWRRQRSARRSVARRRGLRASRLDTSLRVGSLTSRSPTLGSWDSQCST